MNEPQNQDGIAEKVVGSINKDFKLVGSQRVHPWFAWAIVGIVFGMALGIVYVSNQSGQFGQSQAAVATRKSGALRPAKESTLPAPFRIISPEAGAKVTDSLSLTIEFNPGQLPHATEVQFSYAKADPTGKPVGSFAPLAVIPQSPTNDSSRATYVATNFSGLKPGPYYVKVASSGLPTNSFVGIMVIKQMTAKINSETFVDGVTRRGNFSDERIGCFSAGTENADEKLDVPGDGEEPKYIYKDGKYYDQGHTGGCALTTLINMNIDAFGVDTKDVVLKCAAEAGVVITGPNAGATLNQIEQMLSCKISHLPPGNHASGLMISGGRNGLGFDSDPDGAGAEKSPCDEIKQALAGGGSAAITITGGRGAHVTQVIAVDCKNRSMSLRDPNGFIIKLKFIDDLLVGAQPEPPDSNMTDIYNASRVYGVVIEHKK